jgi:hypothetical protein
MLSTGKRNDIVPWELTMELAQTKSILFYRGVYESEDFRAVRV